MKQYIAMVSLFAFQAGAYAVTADDLKGNWVPNIEKSKAYAVVCEKAKCERNKWDAKTTENRVRDTEKCIPRLLQETRMLLSFDGQRMGMLMGGHVNTQPYTAAADAGDTIVVTVVNPQNGKAVKNTITFTDGKCFSMKNERTDDFEWVVWEKSHAAESALDPKIEEKMTGKQGPAKSPNAQTGGTLRKQPKK